MANSKKDILADIELKKMPFTVPEGYFENFKVNIGERHEAAAPEATGGIWRSTAFKRLSPYLAMAAMFAIIVAAGTGLLKMITPQDNLQEYGEFAYVDLIPLTDENVLYSYNYDTYEISDEDLIEYLYNEGIDLQDFN